MRIDCSAFTAGSCYLFFGHRNMSKIVAGGLDPADLSRLIREDCLGVTKDVREGAKVANIKIIRKRARKNRSQ